MDISVIVPVYNVEKYLPKCLDSLCAQDDCVKEIILINDGSTDGSLNICNKFAKKDPRIKIICQENKGLSATVRVGVNKASCEYIGFVDSDDYVEPDMFKQLSDALLQSGADIAFCDYDRFDENDIHTAVADYGITTDNDVFIKKDGKFSCALFPTLKDGRFIPAFRVNKLFKRDAVVSNISFVDKGIRVGEDVALTLPIMFNSQKIVYVRECLYHYFQRSDSLVHTYNRNNLRDWHLIMNIISNAAVAYDYRIEDFNDVSLAWLLSICLYKVKISSLSKKAKKEEYNIIGEDSEVREMLNTTKIKTNIKHRLVFSLLKHRLYGILALVY